MGSFEECALFKQGRVVSVFLLYDFIILDIIVFGNIQDHSLVLYFS